PYLNLIHFNGFDFKTFCLVKYLLISIIALNSAILWTKSLWTTTSCAAISRGSPFLKKSSFLTGFSKNISSLKKTNCSDKPLILCKLSSIGLELNVGKYFDGI